MSRSQSGWRVALFLAAVLVGGGFLVALLSVIGVRSASGPFWDPRRFFAAEVVTLAVVAAVTYAFMRWEHRPLSLTGLAPNGAGRQSVEGVVWGVVAAAVLVGAIVILQGYSIDGFHTHGAALIGYLALWVLGFAILGLAEELTWRAYPLTTLMQSIGFWPAAIILSVLFGALHLTKAGVTVTDVLSVTLFGLFWCYTVRQTGAIWFAVGFHSAFNFVSLYVFGSPNGGERLPGRLLEARLSGGEWLTGGNAGAEASLLVFPLIGLLFLLFHARWPQRRMWS